MSSRCAESRDKGRVAIVGAPTAVGTRVRDALVAARIPGARVDLYGGSPGEVLLGEYAGEARMIQHPELSEIAGHAIVFLCEAGEVSRRIATSATPDCLIIDLLDSLPLEARPRRVHLDLQPEIEAAGPGGCYAVPHPLTLLLIELLQPIEREFGLGEAVVVIVRPAADFGQQGLEELREQTVCLLRFADFPVETFGRQLAFNVIPQAQLARHEPGLERRIATECAELLGWDAPRLGVKLLAAPIFHGHALQLRVRPGREAPLERIAEVLGQVGRVETDGAATPLEAEARLSVSDLSDDGLGGFWLWVVATETESRGAEQAVRLAARMGRL